MKREPYWLHVLLLAGAIITVFPFLWMLSTSLKAVHEVYELVPTLIPRVWRWSNYAEVVARIPFGRIYLNTVLTAVLRTVGEVGFAAMAGYAFARIRFPGRDALFVAVLAVLMIPPQVTMVPNYVLLKELGWLDTYHGVVIPRLWSAYGTFLFRQFFMTIPEELVDATRIDGCIPPRAFVHVALPLAQPVIAAFGFLSLLYAWNDFLWPLIVIQSTKMNVLAVGISFFQDQNTTNFPLTMAASTMAIMPVLFVFSLAQRYLVEGITLTGMK
jgi:multiple sugar transport system permease protein